MNNVHDRIDQIQRNIKENSEKNDQRLREMEDRLLAGMSSFFLTTYKPNVHENKRPINITFRNQFDTH